MVRSKITLGRAYILTRAEYYASMLYNMTIEVVNEPGLTMGITRGLVLYVNGEWILTDPEMQSDEVVGACLVHECEHPLRGFERLDALPNKELANIAGDEAINFNLREEGWKLPSWVVYPETYKHPGGLTLEQYYALHQKEMGEGQSLQQYMDGTNPGGGAWSPKIGAGGCGSGGGNAISETLEKALDAENGKSPVEVESARRQTIDDIETFVKSQGDTPKRLKELIHDRYKKPEVNWRSVLRYVAQRSFQTIAGASDYSMSRPSISSQLMGYIGAGLVDKRPDVALIEDTSASMGTPQLVQARGEAYQVFKELGLDEVLLVQADTAVAHTQRVRLRSLPKIEYHGRGGTNFTPAFDYLRRKHPRVNLAIYFTDGDGRAPQRKPPGVEVIWCIVRTPHARKPARWGHIVVCDKNQKLLDPL